MDKTVEILNRAAEMVERGPWQQGIIQRGCLCANVAIIVAGRKIVNRDATPHPENDRAATAYIERAQAAMVRHLGYPTEFAETAIIMWNDAPERTQQEVVGALRAAAVKVAER